MTTEGWIFIGGVLFVGVLCIAYVLMQAAGNKRPWEQAIEDAAQAEYLERWSAWKRGEESRPW